MLGAQLRGLIYPAKSLVDVNVSTKEEPIRTHSPPLSRMRYRTDREHSPLSGEATLTPPLTTVRKDRAMSPMHACVHFKTDGHDPSAVGLGWRLRRLWRLLRDFLIVLGWSLLHTGTYSGGWSAVPSLRG